MELCQSQSAVVLFMQPRDGSGSKWSPVLKVWEELCDKHSKVSQNTDKNHLLFCCKQCSQTFCYSIQKLRKTQISVLLSFPQTQQSSLNSLDHHQHTLLYTVTVANQCIPVHCSSVWPLPSSSANAHLQCKMEVQSWEICNTHIAKEAKLGGVAPHQPLCPGLTFKDLTCTSNLVNAVSESSPHTYSSSRLTICNLHLTCSYSPGSLEHPNLFVTAAR